MMRAASLLRRQEPVKRISFPELKVEHSAAVVPGDGPFQVRSQNCAFGNLFGYLPD